MPDPAAASTTPATAAAPSPSDLNDQAVLQYLTKKGLGAAALELSQLLHNNKDNNTKDDATTPSSSSTMKERLQQEDMLGRNQRSLVAKSTGGGYGYDRDSAWPIVQWGMPDTGRLPTTTTTTEKATPMGVEEARAYLDAFCSIQLWVLGLPDADPQYQDTRQLLPNPIHKAYQLVKDDASLETVVQQLVNNSNKQQQQPDQQPETLYNLPPSCKAELLAVTFALLVHTYCELLEVGMETTAHTLRDAFQPLYSTLYAQEYKDLYQCTTVEDIVRLNSHNSQHMEALAALKSILVQVASYQMRREELVTSVNNNNNNNNDTARLQKIQDYDKNIYLLKQKYRDLAARASAAFDKMQDLPFLRRARAVRWQLTLATSSFGMLCAFMNSRDESLLVMSSLLQTKCELHVEKRDPMPFTPACVLHENQDKKEPASFELNKMEINWAAPAPRRGDDVGGGVVPFPKFHLQDEYQDDRQAEIAKRQVEFNRALLVNGFRRLEALEKKREYEALPGLVQKRIKSDGSYAMKVCNPLKASILLTTLCTSSSGPVLQSKGSSEPRHPVETTNIWEESGIGLCCAKVSPPDGRRVAVGCDDSAVRIWNAMEPHRVEPSVVLLGHKNGFPVFDVDWNRDGRTLLSAGGDGSVRLWDTMAVGPFGEVAPVSGASDTKASGVTSETLTSKGDEDIGISGTKPEDAPYSSGAALAVYRGHVPNSPVWSVSFAPSGYYFASAGGDATARLWVTDRAASPVRLFTGHTSANVNCVDWHPNCNYIISGSDDKTVRLWDIQTGRTVRLLDGCAAGINAVKISPGGQYAAGADFNGVVHLWDLGMGRKVTELRSQLTSSKHDAMMTHALSFSACGTALATGGDDCCVRIWDVRSETISQKHIIAIPTKAFPTRKTLILDLSFTKRNLLLSVGKFVTPVPLILDSD